MRELKWGIVVLLVAAWVLPGQARAEGEVARSGRVCFSVAGSPGDAAIVNLTPVRAGGGGDGQLVSSDVANPPAASNVNFGVGSVDPNVAVAPIGSDGQVCFVNSEHVPVHLVADHLGTIAGSSYQPATPSGAPLRRIDTRPPPAPPRLQFAAGQYLVGSQIPAGRYEMKASTGCYWERQSGLGGSLDDVIANDFRGFAGRAIVDISGTDRAFEFDAECGMLSTYTGSSAQSTTIVPGSHAVGQHIRPGTYVSMAQDGCYWERLSSFSGEFESIITNDFVSSAGQQFVTIDVSDEGFFTDVECGTWQRVS